MSQDVPEPEPADKADLERVDNAALAHNVPASAVRLLRTLYTRRDAIRERLRPDADGVVTVPEPPIPYRRGAKPPETISENGWFLADLRDLSRASKVKYRTCVRALRWLREHGLVATRRDSIRQWVSGRGEVTVADRNWYLVVGDVRRRNALDEGHVPGPQWRAILAGTPIPLVEEGDGPEWPVRMAEIDARLAEEWSRPVPPDETPNDVEVVMGLGDHGKRSDLRDSFLILSQERENQKRDVFDNSFQFVGEGGEVKEVAESMRADEPDDGEVTPELVEMVTAINRRPRRKPRDVDDWRPGERLAHLERTRGYRLSRPRTIPGTTWYLSYESDDAHLAWQLVCAWRCAVRTVFQVDYNGFRRGGPPSVAKSKWGPTLIRAARLMRENGVPPEDFAVWRLTWLRDAKKRKDPPPMTVVFAEKTIARLRGFFQSVHEPDAPVTVVTRANLEQLYRLQEVGFRRRGVYPYALAARWYADMRRREIAGGYEDPLALFVHVPEEDTPVVARRKAHVAMRAQSIDPPDWRDQAAFPLLPETRAATRAGLVKTRGVLPVGPPAGVFDDDEDEGAPTLSRPARPTQDSDPEAFERECRRFFGPIPEGETPEQEAHRRGWEAAAIELGWV